MSCKLSVVLVLCMIVGAENVSWAQSTQPTSRPSRPSSPTTQPAQSIEIEGDVVEHLGRSPILLREGTSLVEVKSRLVPGKGGVWQLITDTGVIHDRKYHITLLPCALLRDMVRVVEQLPPGEAVFEVTGKVYVFHNRNYLLITHAPRLVETRPTSKDSSSEPADSTEVMPTTAPADSDDGLFGLMNQGESAADVIRDLESETGALPVGTPNRNHRDDNSFQDGKTLVRRRGRITRDAGGAWMFVFEADASGLGDEPLVILPCLLLERMSRFARGSQEGQAILLTGKLYQYGGRGYILPRVFIAER